MKKTSHDLKDLKKMLKETAAPETGQGNEKKVPPARRNSAVRKPVEKDQTSGEAGMLGIRVGGRVALMEAELYGTVTAIRGSVVELTTDDGLLMRENIYDVAPADSRQEKQLEESRVLMNAAGEGLPEKTAAQGDLVVDLHIEMLPGGLQVGEGCRLEFQMEVFKRVLRENLKHRGKKITFIHGVGDGILKHAILKELEEVYALRCSWNPFHSGATTVVIR